MLLVAGYLLLPPEEAAAARTLVQRLLAVPGGIRDLLGQVAAVAVGALDLATDCATSFRKAAPDVRKMWNRAFFQSIRVRNGAIADFTYEEPFASLLGSHKGSMVDPTGFEPVSLRVCPCRFGHLGGLGGSPLA